MNRNRATSRLVDDEDNYWKPLRQQQTSQAGRRTRAQSTPLSISHPFSSFSGCSAKMCTSLARCNNFRLLHKFTAHEHADWSSTYLHYSIFPKSLIVLVSEVLALKHESRIFRQSSSSQSPLPFTSQVGCGKFSRPNILDWEVGSLKVGSGTQTRIPIFKISYSERPMQCQLVKDRRWSFLFSWSDRPMMNLNNAMSNDSLSLSLRLRCRPQRLHFKAVRRSEGYFRGIPRSPALEFLNLCGQGYIRGDLE